MTDPVLPIDDRVALVRARHGTMLVPRNDTVVARSLLEYGEYFESEVELFDHLCGPGDSVADIGANLGAHTLALARRVGPAGSVLAVEPQPFLHRFLGANLALNGLHQVEAPAIGVSDRAGRLRLPRVDYARPDNFGGVGLREGGEGPEVPVLRLDEVWRPASCALVKIDVEGMEVEALRGAEGLIRRCRPALYIENDRPERSRELLGLLRDMGYRAWWHYPLFFNPDNHFGNRVDIHGRAVFDLADGRRGCVGFAINMIALPEGRTLSFRPSRSLMDPAAGIVDLAEATDDGAHILGR